MSVRKFIVLFAVLTLLLGSQLPALSAQGNVDAIKNSRVSSSLMALATPELSATNTASTSAQVSGLPQMIIGDAVVIDAISNGDPAALLADLEALGLRNGTYYGNVVSGLMPINAIPALETVQTLGFASAAAAMTNVGSVENEAVIAQRVSPIVSDRFGLDGEGQTVGILSDSFNCTDLDGGLPGVPFPTTYADDIASGDLPPGVNVLLDLPCGSGAIDEGRGMAQLVHDIAPGADLAFYSAFYGQASFAQGIEDLAFVAGSTVVVDDIIYFFEPMFADGIIAQAADTVNAAGVPYFSSAGNRADRAYEAPFRPSGQFDPFGSEFHDFDPGAGVDPFQDFTLQPGESALIILQWPDAYASTNPASPGAATDIDLWLYENGIPVFVSAAFNQGADPIEGFQVSNPTAAPLDLAIGISIFDGPVPPLVKFVNFGSSNVVFDPPLDAPTAYGHNNAAGATAVAAAFWQTTPAYGQRPPLVNAFSSYGGTPIFYDIFGNQLAQPELRPKPEITAVDGSNTTFFFSDTTRDADTNPNFFGTSAAAPNAAAVAALMLQSDPTLTPAEILQFLQDSAIDVRGTNDVGSVPGNVNISLPRGFDNASGAGLIQANRAVAYTISSPSLVCDGQQATIYVQDGIIYEKYNQSYVQAGLYQGVLRGTSNNDVIVGTNLNDRILADNAQDIICAFDGDDVIRAGDGDDRVYAGEGDDVVRAGSGQDRVWGAGGDDRLFGDDGDDHVYGGDGIDLVRGGQGQDFLYGENGDDRVVGDDGDDRLDGGPESDVCNGGPNNDSAVNCESERNIP